MARQDVIMPIGALRELPAVRARTRQDPRHAPALGFADGPAIPFTSSSREE